MITLQVNGQNHTYDGDPSVPLLWVLRDEFGLTGTKFGCGIGQCGACTVHAGGGRSAPAWPREAWHRPVTTIEGSTERQCNRCSAPGARPVRRNAATVRPADHAGDRLARQQRPAEDEDIIAVMARQHLSLRLLPAYRRGDPPRLDAECEP